MAFATFNSGKNVKGRLMATLYYARKKNKARREAQKPVPPPKESE